MKHVELQDIRNVGLIGHGASGKTSLAEALLYTTGVSDRLGKVGETSSVMDYDPDEVKRGYSIGASIAFCEWGKNKINLIDTPGNNNFIGDTPACMRVVDGVVVVIGAEDGVQFFTEKVWQWADSESLQKIIFLNKMDHDRARFAPVLESIKNKFKKRPVVLHMPVGSGSVFSGVVDLVSGKYYAYEACGKGRGTAGEPPAELKDDIEVCRGELIEAAAESDDELLEKYLEEGGLSEEEFSAGLKSGIESGNLIPVLLGSATLNIGTDLLAQAIIDYLPSPDRRVFKGKSLKDPQTEIARKAASGQPLSGMVFKTVADAHAGKLTVFRVFSGALKADSSIYNSTQNVDERVGQIFMLQGKKQIPVSEIQEGDIGTVAKLKVTTTGDTFSDAAEKVIFDGIAFPRPVLSLALVPKSRGDEEKISNALHRMTEADPTLRVERNAQTHELLISGLGQIHLDVAIERMKRRFGVDVDVKPPKVPYRETIRGSTKVQGKYKKQTGGHGQYGDVWIELSPLGSGKGFEFEDKVVGGAIPKQYIPAVEKGILEAMGEGVLAHYPMVDIKISLYDGSYHDVDSSEMAFKIAGSLGFKKGVMDCRPTLLEPVMSMGVVVPVEFVGDVMGDLNSKRAKILGIDADEDSQCIRAHVPMAEILNYAADLRSLTSGRGVFTVEYDHYSEVPQHLSQKVIQAVHEEHAHGKS